MKISKPRVSQSLIETACFVDVVANIKTSEVNRFEDVDFSSAYFVDVMANIKTSKVNGFEDVDFSSTFSLESI